MYYFSFMTLSLEEMGSLSLLQEPLAEGKYVHFIIHIFTQQHKWIHMSCVAGLKSYRDSDAKSIVGPNLKVSVFMWEVVVVVNLEPKDVGSDSSSVT